MAEYTLPDFKIDKNNAEKGIVDLFKIIKPDWNPERIKLEALSGGYSSVIYKCFDEGHPDSAVTVRIKNLMDESPQFVTGLETIIIQKLSQLGHFPKVRAVFMNGYCYDFIKGKPMMNVRHRTGNISDKMMKAMAKELAFIHTVDISDYLENIDMHLKPLRKLLSYVKSSFDHPLKPSEAQFYKETEVIDQLIEKLKFNCPQCIYHGDCHFGNVVWDEETEKACFVDWELTSIGYQFQDIGYFFLTPSLFELTEPTEGIKCIYPDNMEEKFLRAYYEEWCKLKHIDFEEENLADLKTKVHKSSLANLWMFATFSLTFPYVTADFVQDKYKYFERTFKQYLTRKKEILGRDTLED